MIWPSESAVGLNRALYNAVSCMRVSRSEYTATELATQLPTIFNGSESVSYTNGNNYVTPTMIVRDLSALNLLVASYGVQDVPHAEAVIDGWARSNLRARALTPYPFDDMAAFLGSMIPAPFGGQWNNVVLIGHSYGGAAMASLAARLQNRDSLRNKYLYTFGAPKSAYRNLRGLWDDWIYRRVFFHDDPVPHLPPDIGMVGSLFGSLTNEIIQTWNDIVQPGVGLEIDDEDLLGPSENPNVIQVINGVVQPLLMLMSPRAFLADAHQFQQYDIAIGNMPRQNVVRDDVPEPPVRQPVRVPTPGQINTERTAQVGISSLVTQANPTATATNVLATIPRSPGIRFRGRKIRGHRAVLYGTTVVAWVRTKRLQISLTRYLNEQLAGVGGSPF